MTRPTARRPTAIKPNKAKTPTPNSRSGAWSAFRTSATVPGVLGSVSLAAMLPLPVAVALGLLVGVACGLVVVACGLLVGLASGLVVVACGLVVVACLDAAWRGGGGFEMWT
jgi:hypothetical protein